jgi:hypothetical protein
MLRRLHAVGRATKRDSQRDRRPARHAVPSSDATSCNDFVQQIAAATPAWVPPMSQLIQLCILHSALNHVPFRKNVPNSPEQLIAAGHFQVPLAECPALSPLYTEVDHRTRGLDCRRRASWRSNMITAAADYEKAQAELLRPFAKTLSCPNSSNFSSRLPCPRFRFTVLKLTTD